MQAEKKVTPFFNVLKHRELTSCIEDLTEQLEDLRSEREIVLRYLNCEEAQDTAKVKKNCAKAETMLEKIEVSESKYSHALDDAKIAFADLQEQAKEFDADELYEARLAIRPAKEQDAVRRLQKAYGDKYDESVMSIGKQKMNILLSENKREKERVYKTIAEHQTVQHSHSKARTIELKTTWVGVKIGFYPRTYPKNLFRFHSEKQYILYLLLLFPCGILFLILSHSREKLR